MPAPCNRRWTDAMDDRLVALWQAGQTAMDIYLSGEFPSMTRNAIIGRIHRVRKQRGADVVTHKGHEPAQGSKKKKRKRPSYSAKRQRFEPVPPTPIVTVELPAGTQFKSLMDIGAKECRFIVTGMDTREHLYCAADASAFVDEFGNGCYCAYHRRVMRAGFRYPS